MAPKINGINKLTLAHSSSEQRGLVNSFAIIPNQVVFFDRYVLKNMGFECFG
jgi:hypothetical protein